MLLIRDPRKTWIQPIQQAGKRHGVPTKVVQTEADITTSLLFMRPHAHPETLRFDQKLYDLSTRRIQDHLQVRYYDDKRGQIKEWGDWMPQTWVTTDFDQARDWAESLRLPIVSKADVGASSVNIRVFCDRQELIDHIYELFIRDGIEVSHCDSQGTTSIQHGYVILQRFIPHDTTYRVNRVGNEWAIWLRHNYPDRPVAQTGNTDPVTRLTPELQDLLEYAEKFTEVAGTRWVCLDILRDQKYEQWRLLETSLCWPWPGVGGSLFFPSGRPWAEQFDIMMEHWCV